MIFFLPVVLEKMEGVSPVELEERAHKFGQGLKFVPLGCHEDEHEADLLTVLSPYV